MTRTKSLYLALLAVLLSPMAANADPILDSMDSHWTALGGDVTFEITYLSGSLAATGDLVFGVYRASDMALATVFGNGYALGDTYSAPSAAFGGAIFGFYLSNTGTGFGGPYTYYSDSLLNPSGSDAMAAYDLGGGAWMIEFEDLFLPLSPGFGDLRVRATGITNVPEPGTLALLGIGLFGMGLARRKKV